MGADRRGAQPQAADRHAHRLAQLRGAFASTFPELLVFRVSFGARYRRLSSVDTAHNRSCGLIGCPYCSGFVTMLYVFV